MFVLQEREHPLTQVLAGLGQAGMAYAGNKMQQSRENKQRQALTGALESLESMESEGKEVSPLTAIKTIMGANAPEAMKKQALDHYQSSQENKLKREQAASDKAARLEYDREKLKQNEKHNQDKLQAYREKLDSLKDIAEIKANTETQKTEAKERTESGKLDLGKKKYESDLKKHQDTLEFKREELGFKREKADQNISVDLAKLARLEKQDATKAEQFERKFTQDTLEFFSKQELEREKLKQTGEIQREKIAAGGARGSARNAPMEVSPEERQGIAKVLGDDMVDPYLSAKPSVQSRYIAAGLETQKRYGKTLSEFLAEKGKPLQNIPENEIDYAVNKTLRQAGLSDKVEEDLKRFEVRQKDQNRLKELQKMHPAARPVDVDFSNLPKKLTPQEAGMPEGMSDEERSKWHAKMSDKNTPIFEKAVEGYNTARAGLMITNDLSGLNREVNKKTKEPLLPSGKKLELWVDPDTGDLRDIAKITGMGFTDAQRTAIENFQKNVVSKTTQGQVKGSYGAQVTGFELKTFLKSLPAIVSTQSSRDLLIKQIGIVERISALHNKAISEIYQRYSTSGIAPEKAERMAQEEIKDEVDMLQNEYFDVMEKALEKVGGIIPPEGTTMDERPEAKGLADGYRWIDDNGDRWITKAGEWKPVK